MLKYSFSLRPLRSPINMTFLWLYAFLFIGIVSSEVISAENRSTLNKVLHDHPASNSISLKFFEVEDSIEAINQICQNVSQIRALLTVSTHAISVQVSRLSKSLNIPTLKMATNDFVNELDDMDQPSMQDYISAAVSVIERNNPRVVAAFIIMDEDGRSMKELLAQALTKSIRAFYIFEVSFGINFESLLSKIDNKEIKNFLLLTNTPRTFSHLQIIKDKGLFRQNYFWTIVWPSVLPTQLSAILPHDSNVALLRGATIYKCETDRKLLDTCCYEKLTYKDYTLSKWLNHVADVILNENITLNREANCKEEVSISYNEAIQSLVDERIRDSFRSVEVLSTTTVTTYDDNGTAITYQKTNFDKTATWSPNSQLKILAGRKNVFPNQFTDWKNRTIRICVVVDGLFARLDTKREEYQLNETGGVLFHLLEYLSKSLNFKPIIYESPDREYGTQNNNTGKYGGCIGEIQNHKAEFSVSTFTQTADRQKVVDFLSPIYEESIAVVIPIDKPTDLTWGVFRPLEPLIWAMLAISCFFAALASYLLSKLSPFSAWNQKLKMAIFDEVHFQSHFWNFVGTFLNQGSDFYPYAVCSRTVAGVWFIFVVILFSAYTADLTSFLTVTFDSPKVMSFEELSANTKIVPVVITDQYSDWFLQTHPGEIFQNLNSKKISFDGRTSCESIMSERGSSLYGCVNDFSAQKYLQAKYCQELYILPEYVGHAPVAFPVAKDAVFKEAINFYFDKLRESGLIQQWMSFYYTPYSQDSCSKNLQVSALSIELAEVGGAYYVLIVMYFLGFVFLFIEYLWVHILGNAVSDFIFF